MAQCLKCNFTTDCSCNLIQGMCPNCFTKTQSLVIQQERQNLVDNPPRTFTEIIQSKGLTQQEKLDRINKILQQSHDKF